MLEKKLIDITSLISLFLLVMVCFLIFIATDLMKIDNEKQEYMQNLETLKKNTEKLIASDMDWDPYIKEYLRFTMPEGVEAETVGIDNQYQQRRYQLVISGVNEAFMADNPLVGSSTHINDLFYVYQGGDLVVNIDLDGVYEHETIAKNGYLYLRFIHPREIYDKIVVIDPGHGGEMPGVVKEDAVESQINLAIAMKLYELLEQSSIKAYFTRVEDVTTTLEDRVDMANMLDADLFLSIHINSALYENPVYSGVQVMYNESLEYEGPGTRELAQICLEEVVSALECEELRCIEGSDIYIIRTSKVPVALIEVGFLTNPEEAERLVDDEYQGKAAQGIFNAINRAYEEGFGK